MMGKHHTFSRRSKQYFARRYNIAVCLKFSAAAKNMAECV